jgi:hypothetical protein
LQQSVEQAALGSASIRTCRFPWMLGDTTQFCLVRTRTKQYLLLASGTRTIVILLHPRCSSVRATPPLTSYSVTRPLGGATGVPAIGPVSGLKRCLGATNLTVWVIDIQPILPPFLCCKEGEMRAVRRSFVVGSYRRVHVSIAHNHHSSLRYLLTTYMTSALCHARDANPPVLCASTLFFRSVMWIGRWLLLPFGCNHLSWTPKAECRYVS